MAKDKKTGVIPDLKSQEAAEAADAVEVKAEKAEGDAMAKFIVPYAKAYPAERLFYVTSDKQVFFEKNKELGVAHQNSLKNGKEIQTIKV